MRCVTVLGINLNLSIWRRECKRERERTRVRELEECIFNFIKLEWHFQGVLFPLFSIFEIECKKQFSTNNIILSFPPNSTILTPIQMKESYSSCKCLKDMFLSAIEWILIKFKLIPKFYFFQPLGILPPCRVTDSWLEAKRNKKI